jgi:hypothetical protein
MGIDDGSPMIGAMACPVPMMIGRIAENRDLWLIGVLFAT